MSAMILDVLWAIFESCDRQTLGRAAQVCRSWSELALDALWKDIPGLRPVVGLLGQVTVNSELGANVRLLLTSVE